MELDVGSRIGDYEVISILGVGGMGKVYKVRNALSDRVEAMKVLLPNLAANPELADRFMREIKVQASLEHPNIAQLHTALRVENQLLMLMEFVDGVSLEHKLKTEGPIPVPQAVDAVMQVLSALEFAHQRGVVHRDVKPANIMLTPTGAVKLMDFGIAKGSNDRHLTITGTTLGSLYYMSPEQIQGAQNLDARADLYSIGVTLYELVTGKRPFDGDSQYAIMAAHLEKAPVPPIQVDPRLPQMLNDIILLAVAKDPNARFQGAGAMRAALSNVVPEGALRAASAVASAPAPAYAEPVRMPTVASFATPPPQQPGGAPPAANFAQPGMPPPPPPPPMPRQGGQRGLWMAAGALAAAAVVVGVIYFAPWKGVTASKPQSDTGAQQAQQLTTPPSPQSPAQNPAQTSAVENPAQPGAQPQGQQAATSAAGAPQQVATSPAAAPAQGGLPAAAPATQVAASRTSAARNHSASSQPPAVVSQPAATQQPPPAAVQQQQAPPPQQQAAPQPVAAPPPAPAGPSRAEMQTFREHLAKLGVRANGIQSGLSSLERSQQSMGMNLSSKFTGPRDLMNSYMQGSQEAMNANDLVSAKDLATKAERQIEILEKLLNR